MQVIVAETAGFCMGVDLALKKLDRVIAEHPDKSVFTLGPIIHNPQVLEEYEKSGVRRIENHDPAPKGSVVVIRAHGIPRRIEEELVERGVGVLDATCPKVKRAQVLIDEQTRKGGTLLLYGEENHPEVRGLLSYANGNAIVFDDIRELRDRIEPGRPYFLAAQTTQDRASFFKIRDWLLENVAPDIPVLETICDATKVRQQEAIDVAREVDVMVVAGGYESGNTRRLAKVVRDQGVPCIHVETAEELDPDDFEGLKIVGLTAGASTPDNIIARIKNTLQSF
jgi:4-hydroxy-3-methylbut-2-enyl diphosphate reductase